MADETPKKVVEDSSRCFRCPSLSADNNRVFIFGKSDHGFANIIKTSLNVDVNCYANSKLFICKNGSDCRIPCPGVGVFEEREILQWTLLLFNVCKSVGRVFRVRPRAKRLLRPADEDLEQDRAPLTASESASGLSSTNRAKASKSLQFCSTKDISTTCVSSTNSKQPLPASVRRLQPRSQGFSLRCWEGREKTLASAGHVILHKYLIYATAGKSSIIIGCWNSPQKYKMT